MEQALWNKHCGTSTVEQALWNKNAIKFSNNGNKVCTTLSTRESVNEELYQDEEERER